MRYNRGMSQTPSPEAVRDDYAALPEDARRLAADFLALLRRAVPAPPKRRPERRVPFREDPAFGMWKDRSEMEDSTEYIRQLRRREWREPHG